MTTPTKPVGLSGRCRLYARLCLHVTDTATTRDILTALTERTGTVDPQLLLEADPGTLDADTARLAAAANLLLAGESDNSGLLAFLKADRRMPADRQLFAEPEPQPVPGDQLALLAV